MRPSITLAPRAADTMEELPLPQAEIDESFFYKNLYRTLRGEEDPAIKISEIRRVMKVIDTAFESGRTHSVMKCEI